MKNTTTMKAEEETMVELCSNDVYEILTWLPIDVLLNKGRWVCKEWRDLTYDSNFRRLHSSRTQSLSGYYLKVLLKNHYHNTFVSSMGDQPSHPLDFIPSRPRFPEPDTIDSSKGRILPPPRELKIEASSHHGLLCCVDTFTNYRIPTYYIAKPATREWRQIPNPKTKYVTINMAMMVRRIKQADNSSNMKLHYKILRLSYSELRLTTLHCEIFDSNNWSWKRLNDVRLPGGVLERRESILVHGSFHHWLTTEDYIFVFDMNAENWSIIALPEQEEGKEEETARKKLVEYEGKLGLLKITKKWLNLWVLEEYFTNRRWKREYCIDLEEEENHRCLSDLEDTYSSEISLMKDCNSLSTKIRVPSEYLNPQSYAFDSDAAQGSLSR